MKFYKALEQTIENGKFIKRKVIKNDTIIGVYKNRLYQYCESTMVRYAYSPTNKDIFSSDWEVLDKINELKAEKMEEIKQKIIKLIIDANQEFYNQCPNDEVKEVNDKEEKVMNKIFDEVADKIMRIINKSTVLKD